MAERGSRVLADEEEENVMERRQQEESTIIMAERASRVLANEEEQNVMEGRQADYKDKVQPSNRGAAKEHRTKRDNCLRSLECGRSTRDEPDMHQRCASNAPEMQRSCARDTPECGRCTTCQLHITMAAIVSLQNQLFRGSRSHGL